MSEQSALNGRREVVVFGGTGFLGRRIVRHLIDHEFAVRVATRHPERGGAALGAGTPALQFMRADVADARSTAAALDGVFAAVNAVSLYVERGGLTFRSVHVNAAARLAKLARGSGVARLVHVSGIGADAQSDSPYIRSRGEGETAALAAFADTTVVRPAVMFGPDDAFLRPLVGLLRSSPVFPLFGRGETKLQPADVEDVAEAIVRAIEQPAPRQIHELGGPRTLTYAELIRAIADRLGGRRVLIPLSFAAWRMLAFAAEVLLSRPPITRNQVELMMIDSVVATGSPGFGFFRITPRGIEQTLDALIRRDR